MNIFSNEVQHGYPAKHPKRQTLRPSDGDCVARDGLKAHYLRHQNGASAEPWAHHAVSTQLHLFSTWKSPFSVVIGCITDDISLGGRFPFAGQQTFLFYCEIFSCLLQVHTALSADLATPGLT